MLAFAHQEKPHTLLRPRHPVVCSIDIVGLLVTGALLFIYRPSLVIAALPLAIAFQFCVSILHHWLPYSEWRSRLDRSAIFLFVAAYYLPYWGTMLEPSEAATRLPFVGLVMILGIAFLWAGLSAWLVALLQTLFAASGLVISFYELQVWLTPTGQILFWTATVLYGAQHLIYALRFPNLVPRVFGFREVQHVILLIACVISMLVIFNFL